MEGAPTAEPCCRSFRPRPTAALCFFGRFDKWGSVGLCVVAFACCCCFSFISWHLLLQLCVVVVVVVVGGDGDGDGDGDDVAAIVVAAIVAAYDAWSSDLREASTQLSALARSLIPAGLAFTASTAAAIQELNGQCDATARVVRAYFVLLLLLLLRLLRLLWLLRLLVLHLLLLC